MSADLFNAVAQPKKAPSLHTNTDIYLAVNKLGAYLMRAVSHVQKGMKGLLGEALLFEASEMAVLVRHANRARGRDKLPILDEILDRVEKVEFLLRTANAAAFLPHKTYGPSIDLTESIGKQAQALKNHFDAPATSPAT